MARGEIGPPHHALTNTNVQLPQPFSVQRATYYWVHQARFMTMLLEQHSSNQAGGGSADSRRLLFRDVVMWGHSEVSPTRRLAAWVALACTLGVVVMLLLGP